jgi:hypothetical protein
MLTSALFVAAILAATAPAFAQDRILGLLQLPEVFGYGPCQSFDPEVITLFAAPLAPEAVATIEVDQHWAFAPHGGCEGLKVSVHRGDAQEELPTREYANESPAAIVLDKQDGWFKIRVAGGAAWLKASVRSRFMPMADLFGEYPTLTAITNEFKGPLLEEPGGAPLAKSTPELAAPVRVLEVRSVGDEVWLHLAVMSHSVCDAERGPPDVLMLGWSLAYGASGEPTVWFASRGC